MKKKILILGKGYIGKRLQKYLKCSISGKRIRTFKDAYSVINQHKPKIIINCIGHTGKKNVDSCELVPDKTLQANTFLPILLGEVALRKKIKLIHISSGCIYHFDYKKDSAITEEKEPDFYSLFYSRSKIYTEKILEGMSKQADILIARVRVPLDNTPHPKNILTKLIKYRRIIDVPNSITYIPDFVRALKHLININATGIYNIVCKGGLRYPSLLKIYKKYSPNFTYEVIKLKNLDLVRTNLVLSTRKLEKSKFPVRTSKQILEECVKNYLKSS